MRLRVISAACLLLATIVIALPNSGSADEFTVTDPDDLDPASVVDLRKASMGHGRREQVVHTITTYGRLTPGDLDPDEATVGFAFSTDNNFGDVEKVAFIFGQNGRFRGVLATAGGTYVDDFRVSHPNPKTLRAVLDRVEIDPSSYWWFAFADTEGQGRCCFDALPNRKWVIHDYRPPSIGSVTTDALEGQSVSSSDVPISFTVQDGGIGLDEWRVHTRPTGTESWSIAERGRGEGAQTAILPLAEGATYDVCVAAVDHSGNVNAENLIRFGVPMDDTSAALTFSAGWTSAGAVGTDYEGTRHSTTTADASVSFSVPSGSKAELVAPGGAPDGLARIRVNGIEGPLISLSGTLALPRLIFPIADESSLTQPLNQVEIVFISGTFVVDGVLLGPADPPPLEGRCGLHASRPASRLRADRPRSPLEPFLPGR